MKVSFILLTITASVAFAQNDIIVDNTDAKFTGTWNTGRSTPDRYGDDYRTTSSTAIDATAVATYTPEIAVSGRYNVEVLYPKGRNRTTNAPWLISFSGGTIKTNVNQQMEGQWLRIATGVNFAAGKEGFAQLSNNTLEDPEMKTGRSMVVADAVRFVRIGSLAEAQTTASVSTPAPAPTAKHKAAITKARPDQVWVFSLKASGNGNGTVTRNPDQGGYATHEVVELTAQPKEGFVFAGWGGDVRGVDNPMEIKMTNNLNITAEFMPAAVGVIMEADDAKFDGKWLPVAQQWARQRSETYQYTSANSAPASTATYRPNLPKRGKYDIYVNFLTGQNRATNVFWEISAKTEKTKVSMSQKADGSDWVLLASEKEFDAGTGGYVQLSNQAEPIPSVVVADAVAFVYAGPSDGESPIK